MNVANAAATPARSKARMDGTLGMLALLALLPSWLGLFGGWYWALDLCAHFRWQYLIAGLAIVAWAAWRRRRAIGAFAVLTLLLNLFLIGRLALHAEVSRAALAPDFSLRVVSLNVLASNPGTPVVLQYLLESDADVIALIETNQQWLDALVPLQAKYPHHILHPRRDNFGIALFSRIPLQKARILDPARSGLPSIEARLNYRGRDLTIIATHPVPPYRKALAGFRDTQLAALAGYVRQSTDPVLLVGDLNATPWSAGMRLATSGNLGFRSLAAPWTPTWRARSLVAIPIDHALCTAPLVITRRQVGPDVGSDHRPLLLEVGWAADP
jgi:endonuclease/exonuclease/phosphatase (EEP) superfamily protein YafD